MVSHLSKLSLILIGGIFLKTISGKYYWMISRKWFLTRRNKFKWFLPNMDFYVLFKQVFTSKWLSHILQLYGFIPMWIILWRFKLCNRVNDSLHFSHMYGFTPACILIWFLRLPFCVKSFWQKSHLNGSSLLWIIMWRFKLLKTVNDLLHSAHLYIWFLTCTVSYVIS